MSSPKERLAKIEAALSAPQLSAKEAQARIHFLCTSFGSEAFDWRRDLLSDPVVQLENAMLRSVVAIDDLKKEAAALRRELVSQCLNHKT